MITDIGIAYGLVALVNWRMFAGALFYDGFTSSEWKPHLGVSIVIGGLSAAIWPVVWGWELLALIFNVSKRISFWPERLTLGPERKYLAHKREQEHKERLRDVGMEP